MVVIFIVFLLLRGDWARWAAGLVVVGGVGKGLLFADVGQFQTHDGYDNKLMIGRMMVDKAII